MKILVIGYFATISNKIDGQIAKTQNVHELLKFTSNDISYFDTETFKSSKFNFVRLIVALFKSDIIVYLPASGNLRYIFPVIYFFSLIAKVKVHYFVVGGWLVEFLRNKRIHVKMLKNIAGIYPEIEVMSKRLRDDYKMTNVTTFTNFRICERPNLNTSENNNTLKIIYFARLTPEKGINILFEVAKQLHKLQINNITFDIYGQICYDKGDLQKSLSECNNVKYKGVIDSKDTNITLSNYNIMLFPTHYPGEGCPGTLADSMINGLAIICSDWKYNSEFVTDGYNGYLCDPFSYEPYLEKILLLNQNRTLLRTLRLNSYSKGCEFTHQFALNQIEEFITR